MPEAGTLIADMQPELPLVSAEELDTDVAEDEQVVDPADQDTGDQATPDEPVVEKPEPAKTEEPTPEQAAKRESRRFERRLDKAYRKAADAEARAKLAEERFAELNKPSALEGAPKIENYDYDPDKFTEAMTKYATEQAGKKVEADQSRNAQERIIASLQSAWESKVERAEDKYDDFLQVVGELKPDNAFTAAIMDAENGEEIAYHLAKNEKEFNRIANLHPLAQAREIGKLEAKLQMQPVKPKVPSKAPAPIVPLAGDGATPGSDTPSDNDDMATWMKKRQKQVHGRD